MKALKEKRVSLRSLFRRSLVILSILALAFMACGGDDETTNEPGPSEPGGPTTPPAGPTATSIVILQQPVNESFQGLPPDLTGVVAEVYWSDGKREVVSDTSKFFSLPGYCDYANAEFGTELPLIPVTMSLGYVGSQAISASLIIPMVVPADSIEITGSAKEKWYADRRPDFTGLTYEVTFKEGYYTMADVKLDLAAIALAVEAAKPGSTLTPPTPITFDGTPTGYIPAGNEPSATASDYVGQYSTKIFGDNKDAGLWKYARDGATEVGLGSGKYKKVALPMTDAYPKVVLTQAKSDNKITVRIGSFSGMNETGSGGGGPVDLTPPGSGVLGPVGGSHHNDVPFINAGAGMIMEDGIQTTFAIKEYLEVSGVEFVSASSMPDIYDDDGLLFYTFKDTVVPGASETTPMVNKKAVLDSIEKWGLKFKVFYFGGETREINFDEFMGNNAYYNTVVLAGGAWNNTFIREDVVITADPVTYQGGLAIMAADEDSGNWNLTLEYSPVNYRAGGADDGAWITQVDVPIPVYIFDDTIVVRKNAASGLNNIRINGTKATTAGDTTDLNIKDNTEFTDAANAKWVFEGTYARGRDRKQRAIKFNDEMFLWAELLRDNSRLAAAGTNVSGTVLAAYKDPGFDILSATATKTENSVTVNNNTPKLINNAVASHPDFTSGTGDPDAYKKSTTTRNNPWPGTPNLAVLRDHWIGVYYRGQYLSDEDAVIVDVINLLVPPATSPY